MASPTDIRKGKVINYNGVPHLVLEMLHRTQGRQAGFVQTTLRNLRTNATTTTKFRSSDSVVVLTTDTQRLEYSYKDREASIKGAPLPLNADLCLLWRLRVKWNAVSYR